MAKGLEKQKGFTLVEILVALTIFTIGVLAVAAMQGHSIRYNATARLTSEGVFKAEKKVEELLAGSYAGLANGQEPNAPHALSWTVTDHVTHKTIALTVTWKDSSGNKSFSLNTIKGNF